MSSWSYCVLYRRAFYFPFWIMSVIPSIVGINCGEDKFSISATHMLIDSIVFNLAFLQVKDLIVLHLRTDLRIEEGVSNCFITSHIFS